MKIWNGYGSEHSMNLVLVGKFKTQVDAEEAVELIDKLTKGLENKVNPGEQTTRFSDELLDLMKELNYFFLAPSELEQFLYDHSIDVKGNELVLKTEESDISAFLKLLVHEGAKVEVYSAHDYPDEKYGRGK